MSTVIGEHLDLGPIDWTKTYFNARIEKPVATGQVITEIGKSLTAVNESGVMKVQESAGVGGDIWSGCAILDTRTLSTWVLVESLTVPTLPSAQTLSLTRNNIYGALGTSSVRVYDVTGVALLTEVAAAPAATQYAVNYTTGVLTFNVAGAEAGHVLTIQYRYNMTVRERNFRFQEDHVNLGASAMLGSVSVGEGPGELYTIMYDTSVDYSTLPVILTGADGMFTSAAGGVNAGRCIKAPSVDDPYLGIKLYPPNS